MPWSTLSLDRNCAAAAVPPAAFAATAALVDARRFELDSDAAVAEGEDAALMHRQRRVQVDGDVETASIGNADAGVTQTKLDVDAGQPLAAGGGGGGGMVIVVEKGATADAAAKDFDAATAADPTFFAIRIDDFRYNAK